jgi:hypothetical protein
VLAVSRSALSSSAQEPSSALSAGQTLIKAEKALNWSAAEAAPWAERALSLAQESGDPAMEVRALIMRGRISQFLLQNKESEAWYNQALVKARANKLDLLTAEALLQRGKLFVNMNHYESGV